jgi:hypothetical protein
LSWAASARGAVEVLRHADHLDLDERKGVAQALLDQRNGEMGDVDADPLPVQLLRRVHGGAATAKRIEHHIAFIG